MILFLCRLRAANSARPFDTLRGSCQEAGPFLRTAKSAFKDGKADCHDHFANWSRNDMVFTRGAVCGGAHGPRPTAEYFVGQGPRALPWVRGKNPPVTVLPCQPPLGKGAKGTGVTDCHSQCAHWLRNDREFYKGRGGMSGGRTESSAPTKMLQVVRWRRDDVGIVPYGM